MRYITGIVIAFFLAGLLLSKKNKSTADKLLSAWLCIIGLHLTLFYFVFTGKMLQFPWLLGWEIPLPLVHGPFLYLYSAALVNRLPVNRKWTLLHFIPAALTYLYLIGFFVLSAEQKIFVYQHEGRGYETFRLISLIAIIISGIAYIIWSNLLLIKHRKAIVNQFSSTDKINLKWLQYLSFGIGAIWLAVIVGSDEVTYTVVVLFILFMGYFGIKQVGIFTESVPAIIKEGPKTEVPVVEIQYNQPIKQSVESQTTLDSVFESTDKRKYSRSGLSVDMAENLHKELVQLMEREKVYSESELSLAQLAKRLAAHPNYLSQVINEKEGKNFYDYINTLRIEEFKRLIANPASQRFTILSLAYEVGFNSKSSFNRYFKKETSKSPSEYLRDLNIVEQ